MNECPELSRANSISIACHPTVLLTWEWIRSITPIRTLSLHVLQTGFPAVMNINPVAVSVSHYAFWKRHVVHIDLVNNTAHGPLRETRSQERKYVCPPSEVSLRLPINLAGELAKHVCSGWAIIKPKNATNQSLTDKTWIRGTEPTILTTEAAHLRNSLGIEL